MNHKNNNKKEKRKNKKKFHFKCLLFISIFNFGVTEKKNLIACCIEKYRVDNNITFQANKNFYLFF